MIKVGDILLAKPYSQDVYFKRSVIYLCEHNKHGSLGFMINKSNGLLLKDIFPHLKNAHFPLFEGGPVSPNQLFYTHTLGEKLKGSHHIIDNVYWGGNFMQLTEMIENKEVFLNQIRFYIGYTGWSIHQLNDEIDSERWLINNANYDNLAKTNPFELWGNEILKLDPRFKVFTDYAFEPSLN